jgi:hypothetical protein
MVNLNNLWTEAAAEMVSGMDRVEITLYNAAYIRAESTEYDILKI